MEKESSIKLILATKDDVSDLKVELVKSFGKFCVGQFGVDGVDLIPPPFLLDECFEQDDQILYIISFENKRIGATLLTKKTDDEMFVDLLFLFDDHPKGIGTQVWLTIEASFPEIKIWKLLTPYCEKRNINFYINKCGFKIVEYFNDYHKDKIIEEFNFVECDYGGFFLFEKEIKKN